MTTTHTPEPEPPAIKKQKLENTSEQCAFYLAKKKRTCRMQRKAGNMYCSEHMIQSKDSTPEVSSKGERVPCPKDPRHTVWSNDVERHLKRCKKVVQKEDLWFHQDFNVTLQDSKLEKTKVNEENSTEINKKDLLHSCIEELRKHNTYPPLELNVHEHPGLNNRLEQVQQKKHPIQQSSLIGNLKSNNLLGLGHRYIEFGCGKAELSRFVNLSILEDLKNNSDTNSIETPYGFGFIDRGVNRMKMDPKILLDVSEFLQMKVTPPTIVRTRIDIKDLHLDTFLEQFPTNDTGIVCISKHLCGAATDLTLKLLLNSQIFATKKFSGLLVAMCCRHVCLYEQLLPHSREFLAQRGFKDENTFAVLKKIASWAVCGRPEGMGDDDGKDHTSGLSYSQREELGQQARRLIDESRVYALKHSLPSTYEIKINWYVPKDITLENVTLSILPQ